VVKGPPRSGKTTLVKKVVKKLQELNQTVSGFYTEEVRRGGQRQGFSIMTLSGKKGRLASRDLASSFRVGGYGVDIASFEKLVLPELKRALNNSLTWIVIDEIGKMELYSENFVLLLKQILRAPNPILATLGCIRHPIVREINQVKFTLFELKPNLREEVFLKILSLMKGAELP
jgi:nucleoside-triphosphatase